MYSYLDKDEIDEFAESTGINADDILRNHRDSDGDLLFYSQGYKFMHSLLVKSEALDQFEIGIKIGKNWVAFGPSV